MEQKKKAKNNYSKKQKKIKFQKYNHGTPFSLPAAHRTVRHGYLLPMA
jgi:hypothetical protein